MHKQKYFFISKRSIFFSFDQSPFRKDLSFSRMLQPHNLCHEQNVRWRDCNRLPIDSNNSGNFRTDRRRVFVQRPFEQKPGSGCQSSSDDSSAVAELSRAAALDYVLLEMSGERNILIRFHSGLSVCR